MATTHRSELVDAVTNALMDEAYDGGMGPMSETEFPRHVRRLAETALEAITESQDGGAVTERVQLSRKRGWRKPENTVVVARPSRYGNPVKIVPVSPRGPFDLERDGVGIIGQNTDLEGARRSAVERYRDLLLNHPHLMPISIDEIRAELAGRNLACWCPLDQPCHADVLLEIANGGTGV